MREKSWVKLMKERTQIKDRREKKLIIIMSG